MDISCLCITEDRPEFMEFLLWNYHKQSFKGKKELVVIDSSLESSLDVVDASIRVIDAPTGTNIPTKRNIALEHARGRYITWFDDDDWQHPDKLKIIIEKDYPFIASDKTIFVRIDNRLGYIYRNYIFPGSIGVLRKLVSKYDERKDAGSHAKWIEQLDKPRIIDEYMHFLVVHDKNISNPLSRWSKADIPISDIIPDHGLDKIQWQPYKKRETH
jgi:glycosyltransferase involved in cell wall biosynthesis